MFYSCQPGLDYEAEAKAIKEVIIHETNCFGEQDYQGIAASFVKDSTAIRMSTGARGHIEWIGWEQKLEPLYRKTTEADWSDYKILSRKWDNWKIKVYPESAWAIYNEYTDYSYQGETEKANSREIRFLEKEGGQWRIVMVHWIDLISFEEADTEYK
jgi:hypothetical protein